MQNMQNKDAWNLNKGEIIRIYGLAQTQKMADITFCRNILNLVWFCVNRLWRELVVHLDSLAYLIFVISFTQTGFSKTKFYTQKND